MLVLARCAYLSMHSARTCWAAVGRSLTLLVPTIKENARLTNTQWHQQGCDAVELGRHQQPEDALLPVSEPLRRDAVSRRGAVRDEDRRYRNQLLREANSQDAADFTKDVRWKSVEPIFTTQSGGRSVRGWRNLNPLRPFHSPLTQNDPAIEIYDELVDGRIVIVDLHVGAEAVTRAMSEDITRRLLSRQTEVFTSGKEPPHIQVMLEEAHNLFSSDRYKDDLDVWVKLAKEASKLNLGMTYATQEVSGVAHQVKANTRRRARTSIKAHLLLGIAGRRHDTGSPRRFGESSRCRRCTG